MGYRSWHGRRAPRYRTEWRAIWRPDNATGRPVIEVYYPHRVPVRTSSAWDVLEAHGLDLALGVLCVAAFAAAVLR